MPQSVDPCSQGSGQAQNQYPYQASPPLLLQIMPPAPAHDPCATLGKGLQGPPPSATASTRGRRGGRSGRGGGLLTEPRCYVMLDSAQENTTAQRRRFEERIASRCLPVARPQQRPGARRPGDHGNYHTSPWLSASSTAHRATTILPQVTLNDWTSTARLPYTNPALTPTLGVFPNP